MMLKDIMNTGARFNNRRRPEGWLTPSTAHLLRTHLSLNGKVCQILPVTRIAVELDRFAFMTMDDPAVRRGSTRKAHSMAAMESGRLWRISQAAPVCYVTAAALDMTITSSREAWVAATPPLLMRKLPHQSPQR